MGPLTPLFIDAAVGLTQKTVDFALNPQGTVDQIKNAPRAFGA